MVQVRDSLLAMQPNSQSLKFETSREKVFHKNVYDGDKFQKEKVQEKRLM
jgi:hypothetical protein